MNVLELCNKLQNTSWLPLPTGRYLLNSKGNEGRLNIAWVLAGRPTTLGTPFFEQAQTLACWYVAGEVVRVRIENCAVSEYATLLSQSDFLKFVESHPTIFKKFMPIAAWQRAFKG